MEGYFPAFPVQDAEVPPFRPQHRQEEIIGCFVVDFVRNPDRPVSFVAETDCDFALRELRGIRKGKLQGGRCLRNSHAAGIHAVDRRKETGRFDRSRFRDLIGHLAPSIGLCLGNNLPGRLVQNFLSGTVGTIIGIIRQYHDIVIDSVRIRIPQLGNEWLHIFQKLFHFRNFFTGCTLHFNRILYSQIVPVELESVVKFSAVVFFVGKGCLLCVPRSESMRLVTVHYSDRLDGFIFGDRRIFKGVPVPSCVQKNRGTSGNLLHA